MFFRTGNPDDTSGYLKSSSRHKRDGVFKESAARDCGDPSEHTLRDSHYFYGHF
jgi:hypothetical protein